MIVYCAVEHNYETTAPIFSLSFFFLFWYCNNGSRTEFMLCIRMVLCFKPLHFVAAIVLSFIRSARKRLLILASAIGSIGSLWFTVGMKGKPRSESQLIIEKFNLNGENNKRIWSIWLLVLGKKICFFLFLLTDRLWQRDLNANSRNFCNKAEIIDSIRLTCICLI